MDIPGTPLIVLVASAELAENDGFVLDAVEAGVDGLLVREQVSLRELIHALEHIDEGFTILDMRRLRTALAARRATPPLPDEVVVDNQLTPRERTIADHISLGKSTREIADTLNISERTVQTHVSNILAKLGVQTRAEAAVYLYHLRLAKQTS